MNIQFDERRNLWLKWHSLDSDAGPFRYILHPYLVCRASCVIADFSIIFRALFGADCTPAVAIRPSNWDYALGCDEDPKYSCCVCVSFWFEARRGLTVPDHVRYSRDARQRPTESIRGADCQGEGCCSSLGRRRCTSGSLVLVIAPRCPSNPLAGSWNRFARHCSMVMMMIKCE